MTKLAIKGVAAAAGLALATMASPASAAFLVHLNSAMMDQTYSANIHYMGPGGPVDYDGVSSNGITFNVTKVAAPNTTEDLFAFCIDIFHHITLGAQDDIYSSTYGDDPQPALYDGNSTLSTTQIEEISTLVDIGFLLHRDYAGADTSLRTAAIQAAIWEIEHPGSIMLNNGGVSAGGSGTYASYFADYVGLHGAGDRIFTLTDATFGGNGQFHADDEANHQGFAVGWPVPEPATWGLMLLGFAGMGMAIRRQRRPAAA